MSPHVSSHVDSVIKKCICLLIIPINDYSSKSFGFQLSFSNKVISACSEDGCTVVSKLQYFPWFQLLDSMSFSIKNKHDHMDFGN